MKYSFLKQFIAAVFLLTVPLWFDHINLHYKIRFIAFLSGIVVFVWIFGFIYRTRIKFLLSFAGWMSSCLVVTAWVTVLSYSAEFSRIPNVILLLGLGMAIVLPMVFLSMQAEPAIYFSRPLTITLGLGMFLTVLISPPAKRYLIGEADLAIISKSFGNMSAYEALHWVNSNIRYQGAPFTDNALDTYQKKRATCGGMSNLLHKLLLLQNYQARIVHLRGENHIHTLVEYYDREQNCWIFLDPQNYINGKDYGNVNMIKLSKQGIQNEMLPEKWRGYTKFYVNHPGFGYEKINAYDNGKSSRFLYTDRE